MLSRYRSTGRSELPIRMRRAIFAMRVYDRMLKTSATVENWWKPWLVSDNLQIRLFLIHMQRLENWHYTGLSNGYWRFYRNNYDGAQLYANGKCVPMHAGRLYFVPAGVVFDCECAGGVDHLYVHFDLIGLPVPLLSTLFNDIYQFASSEGLEKTIAEVYEEWKCNEKASLKMRCRIKSVLYAGIAEMIAAFPNETLRLFEGSALTLESIEPALAYIDAHLSEALTNERLASVCGMSRSNFMRRFQQCMSHTPADYVQEKRIISACNLLLMTTASIETIAVECGFSDRHHFTRVFTRRMGISPAAFRKQSA